MSVLALWSPVDLMHGVVGPLGATTAAGTALLVDLDPNGPHYGGPHSLADLVSRGPTRSQLEPTQSGPAVLRNGGVSPEAAEEVVAALVQRWPNVVLRCAPSTHMGSGGIALVPLLPETYTPSVDGPVVYQRTHLSHTKPKDNHVLPVPRTATVKALLAGSQPRSGDRWIKALSQLWDM